MTTFAGNPDTISAAISEARAAISTRPPIRLQLTRMQRLHLFALGHIDGEGRRLVEMDVIVAALDRYRDRR